MLWEDIKNIIHMKNLLLLNENGIWNIITDTGIKLTENEWKNTIKVGVYQIVNNINNKSYIGSTTNLYKRIKRHINDLHKNKHHSIIFQRAWNKYDKINFRFLILETCNNYNCIILEQYYKNKINPEYNIAPICGTNFGIKRRAETIEKLRESHIGIKHGPLSDVIKKKMRISALKHINIYGHNRTGTHHSIETKEKIKKSNIGRICLENTKQKISESNKGKLVGDKNSFFCGYYKFHHNIIGEIKTYQKDLCDRFHLSYGHISELCRGIRPKFKGWMCIGKV